MADIRRALEVLRATRIRTKHELSQLNDAIRALKKLEVSTIGGRAKGPKRRRKMSAAARRKIAAAQRARWAKIRKQKKAA